MPHHAKNLALSGLDHDRGLEEINRELLMQRHLDLHREGNDLWICAGRMSYAARIAQMDILIRGGVHRKFPRGFALDEGACQVFAEQALKLNMADWTRFLENRLLVLLEAQNPETVANRTLRRRSDWAEQNQFKHPASPEQIMAQAARSIQIYSDFVDRAERSGTPLLRLSAEAHRDENRTRIMEFEARASVILIGSC